MSADYQIPFEQLDQFYFQEFIPQLHPALQRLATDLRILRHEKTEKHITTVAKLYKVHVGFIPWLLDDIFKPQPEDLFHLGAAWLLTFIDIAMTDSLVDGELPNEPLLPLFQQQIRLKAETLYQQLFPTSLSFWQAYRQAYTDGLNGLAHEAYCTDEHALPYRYEELEKVYQGKGALYRLMVKALGELCQRDELVIPLETVYHNLALVDQILDDTSDWEDDFARGHITMPIVMALEASQYPYENVGQLASGELEIWMHFHSILIKNAALCITLLQESQEILEGLDCTNTKLGHFVETRYRSIKGRHQQYRSMRMLRSLLAAFQRD